MSFFFLGGLLAFPFIFCAYQVQAQDTLGLKKKGAAKEVFLDFPNGEWVYQVYLEGVSIAGSVAEVRLQAGRQYPYEKKANTYCVAMGLRTKGLISWVYKVRDEWTTCFNPQRRTPVSFRRSLREGRYRKYEITAFEPAMAPDSAFVRAAKTPAGVSQSQPKSYSIPPHTQDFLSALFVFLQKWPIGHTPPETTSIPVFLGDSVFHTSIHYQGHEPISHAYYGLTRTYVLRPMLTSFSTFAHERAIRIWVSADAYRVPLRAHLQLKWGDVRVELTQIRGRKKKN